MDTIAVSRTAVTELRRSGLGYLLLGWSGVAAALWGLSGHGFGAAAIAQSIALFALVTALIWRWLPQHLPQRRFGLANGVTLLRGVGVAVLAGWLDPLYWQHDGAGRTVVAGVSWALPGLALALLALDGVDGWLARRQGSVSAFGARLDMETDALLVLVLALLVWQSGRVGGWIVLAGLWRYLFVAAGRAWPALAAPLPYSRRRQTVCVLQIVGLLLCLCPVPDAALVPPLALATLAAVSGSFLLDGWRLLNACPGAAQKRS